MWIDLTGDGWTRSCCCAATDVGLYNTGPGYGLPPLRGQQKLDDMIYVVGNEQNYHFQVLKLVLEEELGYAEGVRRPSRTCHTVWWSFRRVR